MDNLMKKAHEMTKEMIEMFPGTDYKTQLKISLDFLKGNKYLLEDNEVAATEGKDTLPKLIGTIEEIKEAEDIRKHMIEVAYKDKEKFEPIKREIKAKFHLISIDRFMKRAEKETNAQWYIINKGLQAMYFSRFQEIK